MVALLKSSALAIVVTYGGVVAATSGPILPGRMHAFTFSTASAVAQGATKTVWDGVYTENQADRGRQEYLVRCGYCHRDNLTGGGDLGEPALVGSFFISQWDNRSVADLFMTIGTTMPFDDPDTLAPQTVVDIVSFLLKANRIPAGPTAELLPDVEKLRQILITTMP